MEFCVMDPKWWINERTGCPEFESRQPSARKKIRIFKLTNLKVFIEQPDHIKHPPPNEKTNAVGRVRAEAVAQGLDELTGIGREIVIQRPLAQAGADNIQFMFRCGGKQAVEPAVGKDNIVVQNHQPIPGGGGDTLVPSRRATAVLPVMDDGEFRVGKQEFRGAVRRAIIYDENICRAVDGLRKAFEASADMIQLIKDRDDDVNTGSRNGWTRRRTPQKRPEEIVGQIRLIRNGLFHIGCQERLC